AAAQVDVTRAQLQSRANGLGILAVNSVRLMLHGVDGATAPKIESSSASQKSDQHNDESDGPDGRAKGGAASWGISIFAALPAVINLPCADEDQDERPIGPENGPGIERRAPVAVENNRADRDEQDRKNEGRAPGSAVLSHHTPPHSVVRTDIRKSSGIRKNAVL